MNKEDFRRHAHGLVDWMIDYYDQLPRLAVKPSVNPGDIYRQLPDQMPAKGEPFVDIWNDFLQVIVPGMTHWQHPHFHGYFSANTSFPSLLGEMAMATLGAQCMIWDTSPAAAELEERVIHWLRDALGLPQSWTGVIQDTASTATLASLITAREKKSNGQINEQGYSDIRFRVYCSEEVHSSVEKAVKIMGLGRENLVKIDTYPDLSVRVETLVDTVQRDRKEGYEPLAVVAAFGSTSTLAVDDLNAIGEFCQQEGIWLHVDAAYLGSVLLLPEYRGLIAGIEHADSLVYNPHKWLFTHFDCTTYFVKDAEILKRTFEILPEYLKTRSRGTVNDYRDWGIPLGRRFRALKLWFVLRTYGLEGLQRTLRNQIRWTQELSALLSEDSRFELVRPTQFNLILCRITLPAMDLSYLNELNERWMTKINNSGRAFLTHTRVKDVYTIRIVLGQTYMVKSHVTELWQILSEEADAVLGG